MKPRTPNQAKAWLRAQGKSVPEFAKEHGLDEQACYELLNGRQTGQRGKAHAAAVALGMKPAQAVIESAETGLHAAIAVIRSLKQAGIRVIGLYGVDAVPIIGIHPDPPAGVSGQVIGSFPTPYGTMNCYLAAYRGCWLRWIAPADEPLPQFDEAIGEAS